MLGVLSDFCAAFRASGMSITVGAEIDAAQALAFVDLGNRRALRASLAATLRKSREHDQVFEAAFDLFFSTRAGTRLVPHDGDRDDPRTLGVDVGETAEGGAGDGVRLDSEQLATMLAEALRSGNRAAMERLARLVVAHFAGIEATRPVGISYYLFRTIRAINLDGARAALLAAASEPTSEDHGEVEAGLTSLGGLGRRLLAEEYDARIAQLRSLIEAEIARQLVAQRGSAVVARSLRKPMLADLDFMHASRDELAAMRRALYPLAHALATRLNRKRRLQRRGPLDFRATIRRSLSTGGVPLEPRFHTRHPGKPEIVVIADISGSVASFARFTLHLVYALSTQFSKVRSFAFVDGLDEVTAIFRHSSSIEEAIARIDAEAQVSHLEGHSDYGHALSVFADRFASEITHRTNVLILGDARNNYHPAGAQVLAELQRRARHLYWLNPEPRAYWGSGDSIIAEYAPYCDGVFECRNLRQLEGFVDELV